MPPPPNFDLYAALELTKSASQDEITKSYKRLALIHHPDKNLDKPQATARFQQISTAYETLKDIESRQKYDTTTHSPSSGGTSSSRRSNSYDGDELDMEEMIYKAFFSGHSGQNPFGGRGFGGGGGGGVFYGQYRFRSDSPAQQERNRAAEAREQRAADAREQQRTEREMKEQEKRSQRETQKIADLKKMEEDAKKMKFDRETKARYEQERRWMDANAMTSEEKQDVCTHVEFWPKEQQKKKFKCGNCGQKGGMIAFKCPHCAILVCQRCIGAIAAERHSS